MDIFLFLNLLAFHCTGCSVCIPGGLPFIGLPNIDIEIDIECDILRANLDLPYQRLFQPLSVVLNITRFYILVSLSSMCYSFNEFQTFLSTDIFMFNPSMVMIL